jgi:hypothetical protein
VCVPDVGAVIVKVAVVPDTTDTDPWFAPSIDKVTVPVGRTALVYDVAMVTVTWKVAPGAGEVEAGSTASVVGPLATVMLTGVAVETALKLSPL